MGAGGGGMEGWAPGHTTTVVGLLGIYWLPLETLLTTIKLCMIYPPPVAVSVVSALVERVHL